MTASTNPHKPGWGNPAGEKVSQGEVKESQTPHSHCQESPQNTKTTTITYTHRTYQSQTHAGSWIAASVSVRPHDHCLICDPSSPSVLYHFGSHSSSFPSSTGFPVLQWKRPIGDLALSFNLMFLCICSYLLLEEACLSTTRLGSNLWIKQIIIWNRWFFFTYHVWFHSRSLGYPDRGGHGLLLMVGASN